MKIFAYIRVSTDQQAQSGAGMAAQLNAISLYATQKNLTIENVFSDVGISGGTELYDRPGLSEVINSLKKGDMLLIAKRDRLGRDMDIVRGIEKTIEGRKAQLISCSGEGSETTDKKSALIQKTLADLMSQCERIDISDRTKRALSAKKEKGERVGHIQFGYKLATDGVHIEKDPKEQSILLQIRELRLCGMSIREIATELNKREIFNRGNRRWNHESTRHALQKAMAA
jgi:site-specific DNA recombinase